MAFFSDRGQGAIFNPPCRARCRPVVEDLIILGAGATGREIASVVDDINSLHPTWKIIGFLDDDPAKQNQAVNGIKVLGPIASAPKYAARFVISVAVARDRARRMKIVEEIGLARERYATIIHPRACISRLATIGAGTTIMQNAVVNPNAVIGDHIIIQYSASISHDVTVEDYVTIAPAAAVCGFVCLRTGAYVGAGSTIMNGTAARRVTIGRDALVGLGAVVLRDVPAGMTVAGNPARPLARGKISTRPQAGRAPKADKANAQ